MVELLRDLIHSLYNSSFIIQVLAIWAPNTVLCVSLTASIH
jgi:hypothetical protein